MNVDVEEILRQASAGTPAVPDAELFLGRLRDRLDRQQKRAALASGFSACAAVALGIWMAFPGKATVAPIGSVSVAGDSAITRNEIEEVADDEFLRDAMIYLVESGPVEEMDWSLFNSREWRRIRKSLTKQGGDTT